jgi:large subunit ribosomal protein L28
MAVDANLCTRPNYLSRSVRVVAAVCEVCGKHPSFGMNLSHSHRRTKRRWDPNIQRVRALVNGSPRRLHVCTSCIRAGKVTKPPRRTGSPAT